jgi:hypothetical protein
MRNHNDVLAAKEIQDAVMNTLIRWPQLIDPIPQKVGNRTPEFMPEPSPA